MTEWKDNKRQQISKKKKLCCFPVICHRVLLFETLKFGLLIFSKEVSYIIFGASLFYLYIQPAARTFSLYDSFFSSFSGLVFFCSDIKKIYIRLSNFRNFRKLMFNFWNVSHIVENEKVPRNHLRSIATSSDVIKEQFTKLSSSICSCVVCYGLWSLSFQWNIRIIQSK